MRFFLIGMPGSGKTTLGKRVALASGLPFYDTDEEITSRLHFEMPVNPFSLRVTSHVETEQRKIVVELAQSAETAIVATGAEVALVPECVVAMRKSGVIIHIKRNKEIIMKDIENSQGGLFLENMSTGKKINMRGWAVELYAKEQASYEALADITVINDGTVDDGAEKLYRSIHNCMSDTACDQGAKPFPQGEAKGPSGEGP